MSTRLEMPASPALTGFVIAVCSVAILICGIAAGMALEAWMQDRQRQIDARNGPPPRVHPQRVDPFAPYCKDQAGRNEFHRMCAARRRAI
jgi:hypothetical protein